LIMTESDVIEAEDSYTVTLYRENTHNYPLA
jgi:hypothetical protein